MSQSREFCLRNPLCCFSTTNTKGKLIFRYRLSPETFGYTLVSNIKGKRMFRYRLSPETFGYTLIHTYN